MNLPKDVMDRVEDFGGAQTLAYAVYHRINPSVSDLALLVLYLAHMNEMLIERVAVLENAAGGK